MCEPRYADYHRVAMKQSRNTGADSRSLRVNQHKISMKLSVNTFEKTMFTHLQPLLSWQLSVEYLSLG